MNPRYIEELSWRFGEVYAACVDRILVNLARHFKYVKNGQFNGSWDYQVKKLAEMGQVTKETEAIILSMLGDADEALRDTLEAAVIDGLRGCEPELRKAVEKGYLHGGIPELHPTQMNAFKAYYEQSADKLNLVNTVMLESTQWAYQSTVADIVTRMNTTQGILNVATGEVVSGVSSINKAVHDAVQKMVENGITSFIDHGGHKWSPETYVTMDVRTTMANAAREAVFERQRDYGSHLYQVSWHDAARPLCYPWQGKVLSDNGWTGEVEDYEGNTVTVHSESEVESFRYGGGLFGINCGHRPIPFFPGLSRIREPRQDAEENAKAYQESQKQRYLERRLREEKRDLEVLKAQGATDEEIKLQRQKVRKASDNLNEFCDETGRARRRSREATPIKASWPDVPDTPSPTIEKDKITEFFKGKKGETPVEPTTDLLKFKPSSTTKEAEEFAQSFIGEKVDYGKLNVDRANKINEAFVELHNKFPDVQYKEVIASRKGGYVMAANYKRLDINIAKIGKSLDEANLNFNMAQAYNKAELNAIREALETGVRYGRKISPQERTRYEGAAKSLENMLKFNRWGIGCEHGIKGTVFHEFGHTLADQRIGMSNTQNPIAMGRGYVFSVLQNMRSEWKAVYQKALDTGDIYSISKYAATNDREFFAETFAGSLLGEKYPDYIMEGIKKVVDFGV